MEEEKLITVRLAEGDFQTNRMVKKYENKGSWEPVNPKHILSFIPGTIVEVKCKVGQAVKAGEPLMLFNAMKMDNIITSSHDGVIESINVEVGQSVAKGYVMISLK